MIELATRIEKNEQHINQATSEGVELIKKLARTVDTKQRNDLAADWQRIQGDLAVLAAEGEELIRMRESAALEPFLAAVVEAETSLRLAAEEATAARLEMQDAADARAHLYGKPIGVGELDRVQIEAGFSTAKIRCEGATMRRDQARMILDKARADLAEAGG